MPIMESPLISHEENTGHTQFPAEDFRYLPGGIYEHGDRGVFVPNKKTEAKPLFVPRALAKKLPMPPPVKKNGKAAAEVVDRSITKRAVPKISERKKGKADPKYCLKPLSPLDDVLDSLDLFPPIPHQAPKLLPKEDIRNCQDLDVVASIWGEERSQHTGAIYRGSAAEASAHDAAASSSFIRDTDFHHSEGADLAIHSHRSLAADEYPVLPMYEMEREDAKIMAPKIRLPVSMDLNAFLNSDIGFGRVLLGISGDRLVKGLFLSPDQRRHMEENLDDLLTLRFAPPVPKEAFSIEFLPVIEPAGLADNSAGLAGPVDPPGLSASVPEEVCTRPHVFRTASLCWCDREMLERLKLGNPPSRFVVDIHVDVRGYRDDDGRPRTLYVDEVGCICLRRGPENYIPSFEDILCEELRKLDNF